MIGVEESLLDCVTAVFAEIRAGKIPSALSIPDDLPENEIRQLITYINRFLCEFAPFCAAMQQMARGDMEFRPPLGRMDVVQSLKALQSNLRHLTYKTQQIAAGDLDQKVDFMGDFSKAFNTMTQQLKNSYQELEKRNQFIRSIFSRYTSEEIVGALLDVPQGLKLGGEERVATILMSDLRGFTAMSARLKPKEVIECLNLYLESMVEVISRYQGTIDEIIGDGLLVIFGTPIECEDHACKAVACGLAMQLAMTDVNRRLAAQGSPELQMGIGINTGPVVVGNIGSLRRTKYAVVGSNVNMAGRIESFTIGGQVLISAQTRQSIRARLGIERQFEVEAKGASGRLQLFEVRAVGEPFNVTLPQVSVRLRRLARPLSMQFSVLEGKFVAGELREGILVEASEIEGVFECGTALSILSNLKMQVEAMPTGNPAGEIYAKVMESFPGRSRIHFTSVSPALKKWLCDLPE